MSNADIRKAHKLLDYVSQGRAVLDDELKLLRSFLPELPKQKTLEEITEHVRNAWVGVSGNEWAGNSYGPEVSVESWLRELYVQLAGLAPAAPAHPEFLETEADYENAPEGTIVAKDSSGSVCVKTCLWPDMMVLTVKRRALRCGWGDK